MHALGIESSWPWGMSSLWEEARARSHHRTASLERSKDALVRVRGVPPRAPSQREKEECAMTTLATPVKTAAGKQAVRQRVADRVWYAYAARLLPTPLRSWVDGSISAVDRESFLSSRKGLLLQASGSTSAPTMPSRCDGMGALRWLRISIVRSPFETSPWTGRR